MGNLKKIKWGVLWCPSCLRQKVKFWWFVDQVWFSIMKLSSKNDETRENELKLHLLVYTVLGSREKSILNFLFIVAEEFSRMNILKVICLTKYFLFVRYLDCCWSYNRIFYMTDNFFVTDNPFFPFIVDEKLFCHFFYNLLSLSMSLQKL